MILLCNLDVNSGVFSTASENFGIYNYMYDCMWDTAACTTIFAGRFIPRRVCVPTVMSFESS